MYNFIATYGEITVCCRFMVVNKTTVDDFITRTAHEITKKKSKNARIAKDDAAVTETKTAISSAICGGGPKVKATVRINFKY